MGVMPKLAPHRAHLALARHHTVVDLQKGAGFRPFPFVARPQAAFGGAAPIGSAYSTPKFALVRAGATVAAAASAFHYMREHRNWRLYSTPGDDGERSRVACRQLRRHSAASTEDMRERCRAPILALAGVNQCATIPSRADSVCHPKALFPEGLRYSNGD